MFTPVALIQWLVCVLYRLKCIQHHCTKREQKLYCYSLVLKTKPHLIVNNVIQIDKKTILNRIKEMCTCECCYMNVVIYNIVVLIIGNDFKEENRW